MLIMFAKVFSKHCTIVLYFCFALLVLEQTAVANNSKPEIVFDASHNQPWSIWDTGVAGYSQLAITLRKRGYRVSENQLPLKSLIPGLNKNSTLVLAPPQYVPYTGEDIRAVKTFVLGGGSLLILGEHEDFLSINAEQNKIAKLFGIKFNANLVNDSQHNINANPQWLISHSIVEDLTNIGMFAASSIDLISPAEALLNASNQAKIEAGANENIAATLAILTDNDKPLPSKGAIALGARTKAGKGRVAAISDSELFWNWSDKLGINHGNNRKFALSLFHWLAPPKENAATNPSPIYSKSPRIIIDQSHHARPCDDSVSGLSLFLEKLIASGLNVICKKMLEDIKATDTIIIPNPLEEFSTKDLQSYSKAFRIALLAESHTTISTPSSFGAILQLLSTTPINSPIDSLARNFGASVYPHPIEKHEQGLRADLTHKVSFKDLEFKLYRGNRVSLVNAIQSIKAGPSTWAESRAFNLRAGDEILDRDSDWGMRNPKIASWNNKVFVLGDLDGLSNALINQNEGLFKILLNWLMQDKAAKNIRN